MTTNTPPGPIEQLSAKVRRATSDPMTRNSLAIMVSTMLTSVLGYVFWMIAARLFDRDANGTAAATTSAIQATVLIASIGAAAALVEWLPRCTSAAEWRQRVTTGLVTAVITALAGGLLVVGVLGVGTSALPQLGTPLGAVLFCVACVSFSVGLVLDYVAVSEHRGSVLLGRNVVLCGLRIPIVFMPIAFITGADSILLAWTVSAALSLVWAASRFGSRDGRSLVPDFTNLVARLREMGTSLVGQHLITVTAMLAGYLLPVIVYARLSATDNAYFYITWMLGSVFFIISPAVSAALFIEGATVGSDVRLLARKCILVVGALLAVPVIVYLAGGRLILSLFGPDYVVHGYTLLLLLTVSAVPDAVTNVAVAVLRVSGRMGLALLLNGGMLLGCIVGTWFVLPIAGIAGAGWCWLVSQTIGALCVMAFWRRLIDRDVSENPSDPIVEDVLPVAVRSAAQ